MSAYLSASSYPVLHHHWSQYLACLPRPCSFQRNTAFATLIPPSTHPTSLQTLCECSHQTPPALVPQHLWPPPASHYPFMRPWQRYTDTVRAPYCQAGACSAGKTMWGGPWLWQTLPHPTLHRTAVPAAHTHQNTTVPSVGIHPAASSALPAASCRTAMCRALPAGRAGRAEGKEPQLLSSPCDWSVQ